MGVISQLLVHGPNAPFYQSLIEPHIGMDYSPIHGCFYINLDLLTI